MHLDEIIRFEHISMRFPDVLAVDNLSLGVRAGEVFALVGENGAGKSTLMNVLYGLCAPTTGRLYIKGRPAPKGYAPDDAIRRGVGMVHQHFKLVPSFTVAQNICLGIEPKRRGALYDFAAARASVRQLSSQLGLYVDPDATVSELSVGLQQRVEILKTLHRGADILILDEPTAVLTPQEVDELFAVIRRIVREQGMTVIIITHKLYEVTQISDRVGVMRQGRLVGVAETRDVTEKDLAGMMVGGEVLLAPLTRTPIGAQSGAPAIEIKDLRVKDARGLIAVNGASLTVHPGEVLGLAAVEGNGQSELVEALTGLRSIESGDASILGHTINGKNPGQIRALGLSHIPEDRIRTGVSSQSSIQDNLIVGKQKQREFALGGIQLRGQKIARYAQRLFERFDIRAASIQTKVGSLSGGNMQKVVVAREFSFDSPVLVIAQPTRGVDIGAIEFIHAQILEKRGAGCAVLLVSADLDELMRLSDRIVTLYEGRITGEFTPDAITRAEIGYHMTGRRQQTSEAEPRGERAPEHAIKPNAAPGGARDRRALKKRAKKEASPE